LVVFIFVSPSKKGKGDLSSFSTLYSGGLSFENVSLVTDFISHLFREVLTRFNLSSARGIWLAKVMSIFILFMGDEPSGS
jgi:hypothetical protein